MNLTMEKAVELMGMKPGDDPERFFWRVEALKRSKRIAELQRVIRDLRDALAEAEAENLRLHEEMNS